MSALTRSTQASRRSERRERVEAKHFPEAVFVPTEDQALATDRALNVLKKSESYFELPDRFALDEQNGRSA